jgi:RasGEF N-terminal motif
MIKAATVDRLVAHLTGEYSSPAYRSCFLMVFRAFMKPEDVLSRLRLQFVLTKDKSEAARVIRIIKPWVEAHPTDFAPGTEARVAIEKTVRELTDIIPVAGEKLHKALDNIIDERSPKKPQRTSTLQNAPAASALKLPDLKDVSGWSVDDTKVSLPLLLSSPLPSPPFLFHTILFGGKFTLHFIIILNFTLEGVRGAVYDSSQREVL